MWFLAERAIFALARRNHGYHEPEARLWILFPAALLNAGGLLLYGVSVAHQTPWIVPCIGMGIIGFILVIAVSTVLAYALDCYREIAEEAITGVLFIRAIIATGFTFAIAPWLSASGIQNTFIAMAFLSMVPLLGAAAFIKWGKTFRKMTAKSYSDAYSEVQCSS